MGFDETLPIQNNPVVVSIDNFPVMRRRRTVRERARFTTSDGLHHLLSFGEYVALHLVSWSPRLWRALETPTGVFRHLPHWAPCVTRPGMANRMPCGDAGVDQPAPAQNQTSAG